MVELARDYQVLIGTYSDMDALAHQPYAPVPGKGVYAMTLHRDGRLSHQDTIASLNPAVLIPHADGKHLYAILETIRENGTVQRYRVTDQGSLEFIDDFTASGRSTCYLSLSPGRDVAVIINYWDAIIDVCRVSPDGALDAPHQSFRQVRRKEGEWRQVATREDHWGNRQVGPHAHCAHFWHDRVFVPDLGENAIFQYRYDAAAQKLVAETHVEFEAGSGPRHMAMHPELDICYVSNELFNTVCAARLDASEPEVVKPRIVPFQYESTLDDREQTSYVSEITLSPDARFLYVSNRGDDSICIFAVGKDGSLSRRGLVPTGGKFPRHFAITPCGGAVIASNQDSGNIRVFERDIDSGALTMTDESFDVPAPCYVRFLAPR